MSNSNYLWKALSLEGEVANLSITKKVWENLVRQVARRTRSPSEAEDLLHWAYLRLEGRCGGEEVVDPAAFLIKTAKNIQVDNYRRDKRLSEGIDIDLADETPLQDEVIASRVRLERLKEGLNQLSPIARDVLLLRRLHGLKYHEIGEQLGISRSTVERTLARATTFLVTWTNGW
jgi:RNA polymerase sigma-70 factor (ECF subfamily)